MCNHNWIFGTTMVREIGAECSRCHTKLIGSNALEKYFNELESRRTRRAIDEKRASAKSDKVSRPAVSRN